MGLFSSCSNKKHIELVCDIGNRTIGVALVEYVFGEKTPNVIFSERISSPDKQVKSLDNTIAIFSKDFNVLLSNVLKSCILNNIKPSRVSCFYSSPWFVSQTHILKIQQAEPVVFCESIIKKMLEEAEKNFLSEDSTKTNSLSTKDLKIIERKITRIKLNGYQTHNPIGKKANTIEAALFLSALPETLISLIEDLIDRLWHRIKIEHHTFPLASFAMLRNEFNTYGSFLIVNIADNVTDISLINDEMLLDTFSFPIGKRNIIESIENACALDYELASSILSMYVKNEIHSDHLERFTKTMESIKKDWTTHFESACNVLTKERPIPEAVYLITDQKILSFFELIIKNCGLGGYTTIDKDLRVYPVLKNIFDKYINYSSSINKDFFLETEVLYINLISSKEERIIDNYSLE